MARWPRAWRTRRMRMRSWRNPPRARNSSSNWSPRWRRRCATCEMRRCDATRRAKPVPAPSRHRPHRSSSKEEAMKPNLIAAAVAASLFILQGCETAPKSNATLEAARAAVQAAESDPNVSKYAPTELARARSLLVNAEGAAKGNGANDKTAAHYAYLATQHAHIAEQRAQEQVATARVKAGEVERQQILLSAREGEANQALAQARTAQSQAEQARNEAVNAQSQMAQAQAESQRLAAELENLQASQ